MNKKREYNTHTKYKNLKVELVNSSHKYLTPSHKHEHVKYNRKSI